MSHTTEIAMEAARHINLGLARASTKPKDKEEVHKNHVNCPIAQAIKEAAAERNKLEEEMKEHDSYLSLIRSLDFDVFSLSNACGRDRTLQLTASKILYDSGLEVLVVGPAMMRFLERISLIYDKKIEYHNDLHGTDVMQMAYHLLKTCGLEQTLKLKEIDSLSFLMAAVCHDLGHDGFTNSYHVNTVSGRAINGNDVAV